MITVNLNSINLNDLNLVNYDCEKELLSIYFIYYTIDSNYDIYVIYYIIGWHFLLFYRHLHQFHNRWR